MYLNYYGKPLPIKSIKWRWTESGPTYDYEIDHVCRVSNETKEEFLKNRENAILAVRC